MGLPQKVEIVRKKHEGQKFIRDFKFEAGTCEVRDSAGNVLLTARVDDLDEKTARVMCLQQLVRSACDSAMEAMRQGASETDARAMVVSAYKRVIGGGYRPRTGRSPTGVRRNSKFLQKTALAAWEAGFRSLTHGGETYAFFTKDEAYLAFRWLWSRPKDERGVSGRQAYLEIIKFPAVRANLDEKGVRALQILGSPSRSRPLASPS